MNRQTTDETHEGKRLDRFIADAFDVSRSQAARLIKEGRVRIDGDTALDRRKLTAGLLVEIDPIAAPPSKALPEAIPLDIVFEDEHLLAVNKVSGMVVHPAAGNWTGTLVNAVLHHTALARLSEAEPMRPGIVHRLDKGTSGVMVVAKTPEARDGLVELFREHNLTRRYVAISTGPAKLFDGPRTFDTLHGRHPKDRKRFTGRVDRGKRAITKMRPLERLHGGAFVECTLETGRTHQIRVHMTEANGPLIGDETYGWKTKDPRLKQAAEILGRPALHAQHLSFVHPISGLELRFDAPLPPEFEQALSLLRE